MEIKGKNEGHYFKEEHHKRCRSEMQTINGDRNKYRPDWSFIPIGYLTVCSFTTLLANNFVFFMNSLVGYSSITFALNFISMFFARICYIVKRVPFLQVNLWQSEQLTSFHLYSWPRRNPRVWTQSSFLKLFGWWLAQYWKLKEVPSLHTNVPSELISVRPNQECSRPWRFWT